MTLIRSASSRGIAPRDDFVIYIFCENCLELHVQLTKILHDIVSFTFTMRSTIGDFTKVATKSFASASTSQNLYFSYFWLRSPCS